MSQPVTVGKVNSSCGESNGPQVFTSMSRAPMGRTQISWSNLGPFNQLIIEVAVMLAVGWGLIAYYSAKKNPKSDRSTSSGIYAR
jgi:hypothetical protein